MKILFVISTDDAEKVYNAMRLANVAVKKGDDVSVFMLGKGVTYEQIGSHPFDVMEQVNHFEGDFYV
jgi:uncharacterized protein involved in oxidation of intracellular sulfur